MSARAHCFLLLIWPAWLAAAVVMAGTSGCASLVSSRPDAVAAPLFQLAPASLDAEVAALQRLKVQAPGRAEQSVDVFVQVSADQLRLAVLALGRRVLTVSLDQSGLVETRDERVPAAIQGKRIVSDLQLIYWPMAALSAALPPADRLEEHSESGVLYRTLSDGGGVLAEIERPSLTPWQGHARFSQRRLGYTIDIDSVVQ